MTPDALAVGKPVHVREHTVRLGDLVETVEEFDGTLSEAYHGYAVVTGLYGWQWLVRWEYIDVREAQCQN